MTEPPLWIIFLAIAIAGVQLIAVTLAPLNRDDER